MPRNDASPNRSDDPTDHGPPPPSRILTRRDALRIGVGALTAGALVPGVFAPRARVLEAAGPLSDSLGADRTSLDLILKTIPASGEEIPAVGMGTWQTFMVEPPRPENLPPCATCFASSTNREGASWTPRRCTGTPRRSRGTSRRSWACSTTSGSRRRCGPRGRDEGIAQMEQSMSELRRPDHIELMQVHNLVDVEVHLETLEAWKAEGRFRYIGITNTSAQRYPASRRSWTTSGSTSSRPTTAWRSARPPSGSFPRPGSGESESSSPGRSREGISSPGCRAGPSRSGRPSSTARPGASSS
jgi:hypothetical protein